MPRIPDFAVATCSSDALPRSAEIRVSRRGACARGAARESNAPGAASLSFVFVKIGESKIVPPF
jgi:hypothetical protein